MANRCSDARGPWLAALVVLGAGIGVTYTRAGAIGQIVMVGCLLLGRADRRILRAAVVAVVLGLGIGGLGFGDGWVARGETSLADGTTASSSRDVRLAEARELVTEHPITGVGPGRYVEALAEQERDEYLPAHNLLAHQAAELGVLGGLAVIALLALLALRTWRGGAWTAALVTPVVPFLFLDAYPYVFATGLAASAIWLGLVRSSLAPAAAPTLRETSP
jgi:O-antigen ligase